VQGPCEERFIHTIQLYIFISGTLKLMRYGIWTLSRVAKIHTCQLTLVLTPPLPGCGKLIA
jgi:hypothetical protein